MLSCFASTFLESLKLFIGKETLYSLQHLQYSPGRVEASAALLVWAVVLIKKFLCLHMGLRTTQPCLHVASHTTRHRTQETSFLNMSQMFIHTIYPSDELNILHMKII